jgi:hypothetical protein
MIDLSIEKARRERAVDQARRQNILIPTFTQMKEPDRVPENVKESLRNVGLWEVNPMNLFRITWKNEHARVPE